MSRSKGQAKKIQEKEELATTPKVIRVIIWVVVSVIASVIIGLWISSLFSGSSEKSLIPPGGTEPSAVRTVEKKDLVSFPTKLTKGVWSDEICLSYLKPIRTKYFVYVSDSVKIRFRDGSEFTIAMDSSVNFGDHKPTAFRLMALHDNTLAVPKAWN